MFRNDFVMLDSIIDFIFTIYSLTQGGYDGEEFGYPASSTSVPPSTTLQRLVHVEHVREQPKHGGRHVARGEGRALERYALPLSLYIPYFKITWLLMVSLIN